MPHSYRLFALVLLFPLSISLAIAGCGGDDLQTDAGSDASSGGQQGGETASSSGVGGTDASAGVGGGTGSATATTASASSGSTASATAGAGGSNSKYMCQDVKDVGECKLNKQDPCECCAAEKCYPVLEKCCNTKGCFGVVTCAVKTNCSGFDCYSAANCKTEIDAAGGLLGAGSLAAQQVGDCVASSCVGCDQ
jgi:hypothetical protein